MENKEITLYYRFQDFRLKSVLRDYISTSPYVCKYRVGEQAEGGDGVTVIDIN